MRRLFNYLFLGIVFLGMIFLFSGDDAGATNWSYTTVNSMRFNDYPEVTNEYCYGNLSIAADDGIYIKSYSETSDGIQIVFAISTADIPDIATTYLKLDASNDPVTGALELEAGLLVNGATTYNDSRANVDFIVKGDIYANTFRVDASADSVLMRTLELIDNGGDGSDGNIIFEAGDVAGSTTYKWPVDGSAGQVFTTDGSGNISLTTPASGGSIGGDANDVQYNASGSFGGEDAFEYNASTNTLTVDDIDVSDEITCDSIHVGGTSDPGSNNILVDGDVRGGISYCDTYSNMKVADDDGVEAVRIFTNETINEGDLDNQLDVPRPVSITVTGGIDACTGDVQINGIDADGAAINETESFSTGASTPQTKITSLAFARITSIVNSNVTGTNPLVWYGWDDIIGLANYPWGATTDLFKVKLNQDDVDPTNYTINATYGTVDIGVHVAVNNGDVFTFWYRPYK